MKGKNEPARRLVFCITFGMCTNFKYVVCFFVSYICTTCDFYVNKLRRLCLCIRLKCKENVPNLVMINTSIEMQNTAQSDQQ